MVGCAFLAVFVYRKLKDADKIINVKLWKNISLVLGTVVAAICVFLLFDRSLQQRFVDIVFHFQGKGWQKMTATSSLQYLLHTVSTMSIAGLLAGIFLLFRGCWRKNRSVLKISHLYMEILCLVFIGELGLAFASCQRYAMRGHATEGFLHAVIDNSTSDDIILVAGHPGIETEGLTKGFALFMRKYDRTNLFACPLAGDSEGAAAMIRYYDGRGIDAIDDKNNIQAIAIFSGQEESFEEYADWFDPSRYSRHEFAGNYVVYAKK
jgi:hypothetical protein